MPYSEKDASLETRFATEIKQILGEVFIQKDVKADLEQATDFAIFTIKPFKVGVRLRRFEYYRKFSRQITIRWSRPSGAETEIDKIKKDLVQYVFYGFVDSDERALVQYIIVEAEPFKDIKPVEIRPNNPPDSELAAYNLGQIPSFFVIKFWKEKEGKAMTIHSDKAKLGEFL